MRKLKVVSNGRVSGTKVVDVDTGETLDCVERIELVIDANGDAFAKCTMQMFATEVEFVSEFTEVEVNG
jgi:hypothetical protein